MTVNDPLSRITATTDRPGPRQAPETNGPPSEARRSAGRFAPENEPWQKREVESFLSQAGVSVNGPAPWDIQVHDDRFYARALREGDLGIGESYALGWWDCDRLDELAYRVSSCDLLAHARPGWRTILDALEH